MKSMLSWLAFAVITTPVSWGQKATTGHQNISAVSAKKLISRLKKEEKKLVILDVRTPEEYKTSHIAGAKLLDFLADDFKASLAKLDKTKVYLLHCRSGSRSSSAFALMKRLGFKSVYHLDGGILAWRKAGGKTG
ncbi:MAG: rhodanese-like domain-containing protein [Verrucomicrobiaceae bacterium]|nr:rhodanese-like domain-containing protein [Verrucomicrobiaceae bacterium]